MVENNAKTSYNPYSSKRSKIISESKQGNTQIIIDNEIKRKGFKIDELNDWNKITNEQNKDKTNMILNYHEVYSPEIINEDLFKNKQFRSNKDAINTQSNIELLKDYSINTSMFSYKQNMNNYDKIDLSVASNNVTNVHASKSKTRRYKSNCQAYPLNAIEREIRPINEEESFCALSPIEKLTNNNDKEYNKLEKQLFEAQNLIVNLGNQIDEMRTEMTDKGIDDSNELNDSLEENTHNETKDIKKEVHNRDNMYINNGKRDNIQVSIPNKAEKGQKTATNSKDLIKPNEVILDNVKDANNASLPIENFQHTTNVMMQPYNSQIPIQMQMNLQLPYALIQQPIQPSIVNYSNQIYNQPIMQYQQQAFNPYIFYQSEPIAFPIQPEVFQGYPIENVPQYKVEQDNPSLLIRTKPNAKIKKTKEAKPKTKEKSTKNEESIEEKRTDSTSTLRPIQSATKNGYNHIHLLKQIKNKNKSVASNNDSKQTNKRAPNINKDIKEKQQPYNKIYTTMKQNIKKLNNSKERISSAKTTIAKLENNPNSITNNIIQPKELEQMNALLQNHKLYTEKVAKIKETLNG